MQLWKTTFQYFFTGHQFVMFSSGDGPISKVKVFWPPMGVEKEPTRKWDAVKRPKTSLQILGLLSTTRLILHDGSLRTRPKAEMNPSAQPLHVSCSPEMQAYLGQSHTCLLQTLPQDLCKVSPSQMISMMICLVLNQVGLLWGTLQDPIPSGQASNVTPWPLSHGASMHLRIFRMRQSPGDGGTLGGILEAAAQRLSSPSHLFPTTRRPLKSALTRKNTTNKFPCTVRSGTNGSEQKYAAAQLTSCADQRDGKKWKYL